MSQLAAILPFIKDASQKQLEEALRLLDQAIELRRELGEARGLAITINNRGLVYERMKLLPVALMSYQEALSRFRLLELKAESAVVAANRCRVIDQLGRLERARECYESALLQTRAVEYQNTEAQLLYGLAENARRRGQPLEAQTWIERGIEVVEQMRRGMGRLELRSTFLAKKQDVYELAIDLALERHMAKPLEKHDETAFFYVELASARSFLEALSEPDRRPARPPESDVQTALQRAKLESLARTKESVEDSDSTKQDLDSLIDRVYEESFTSSLTQPEILSAEQTRELLDPETIFLEYHLGERYSAVWAISTSEISCHLLAPRDQIEKVARDFYNSVSAGGHPIRARDLEDLGKELSRLILAPVAARLDRPQIVIAARGALAYVPFAALPNPTTEESPEPQLLLLTHRIFMASSASSIAAIRRRQLERPPAEKTLAIVAASFEQPPGEIFSPGDPFPPLPHAEKEVQAIRGLVDETEVSVSSDFPDIRDFVFSPSLRDYRILHFAAHGFLDDVHGELSALILPQFDSTGKRADVLLFAYELAQLDLRAELVVLSACETALGEEIRGEGARGLTRGFLDAGARQVLVSLWRVNDKATAPLMESFYRRHLHAGLPPAEALQQAQVELRQEGWAAPYYWAPFTLHGDWLKLSPSRPRRRPRRKIVSPA